MQLRHTQETSLALIIPEGVAIGAFEAAELLAARIADISSIEPHRMRVGEPLSARDAILIGVERMAEYGVSPASIGYGRCVIRGAGNKLLIAAHTDALLPEAAKALAGQLSYADGTLLFPESVQDKQFISSAYLAQLPLMDAGEKVSERSSLDGCEQVILAKTTAMDYTRYLETLRESGFTLCWKREVCGSLFARLVKESCAAYAYFTPFNGITRLFAEPARNIHTPMPWDETERCAPLMTVLGARFSTEARYLNCDSGTGNMGYVFRLSDGRFVLVDGGMDLGEYAEKIMETLRAQAPDPSHIVIACWFLSHSHIDHTGAFLKLAASDAELLDVREIVCNFPSLTDAQVFHEAWNTMRVREACSRFFPNAKYTKAHTGERFTFGATEIEVLYTQDDLVRQNLSLANETLNTASMCIRLLIAGNSVLLPADCDTTANDIMLKMYGAYLKSDILQVCHHGGWGGLTATYAVIDPELAIFSTSDALLPKYLQIEYNHALVYEMHVKEVYNNADRCRTFTLPYHPTQTMLPPDPAGEVIYTEAKQLESIASIETIQKRPRKK